MLINSLLSKGRVDSYINTNKDTWKKHVLFPIVLRLALNQSRRDLSDAQAKLNEYRYISENETAVPQSVFDELEREHEKLKEDFSKATLLNFQSLD